MAVIDLIKLKYPLISELTLDENQELNKSLNFHNQKFAWENNHPPIVLFGCIIFWFDACANNLMKII